MISRNDHSDFCFFLFEAWAIYWILSVENLLLHHDVESRNLSAICR